MFCTSLPKSAKPVWANQLTQLPCLVVNVKFQFMYSFHNGYEVVKFTSSPTCVDETNVGQRQNCPDLRHPRDMLSYTLPSIFGTSVAMRTL